MLLTVSVHLADYVTCAQRNDSSVEGLWLGLVGLRLRQVGLLVLVGLAMPWFPVK